MSPSSQPAAMPRGRDRKPNPHIPAHIDQAALPRGIYFNPLGIGHWYVLVRGEKGRKKKRYVATSEAKLSELHRLMEAAENAAAGSLDDMWKLFQESDRFKRLATSTREGYTGSANLVLDFKLRDGSRFGAQPAQGLRRPVLQRLVDVLAKNGKVPTPSRAVHAARFLAVFTNWGANRGYCPGDIANKLDLPKEKKDPRMPEVQAHDAIVAFARERGALKRQRGAVAPYLWAVAEIAYLCRLRGSEVCDMNESRATEEGILCIRRKGSEPNVVQWDPRLRAAWLHLLAERDRTWKRRKMSIPIRAEDRPVVVGLTGDRLTRKAATQAWRKMQVLAVEAGVIPATKRHGMHGLKHRGVTDTEGNRSVKREASGHKTEAMVARYDHHVPTVLPATRRSTPKAD